MYRDDVGGRSSGPPQEMHAIICEDCGKETEVPFEPDGVRPVYCKECYQKRKPKKFGKR